MPCPNAMLDTIMPNNKFRFFFASIILTPPPALVKQRGTRTYLGLFVCDSHVRARLQPCHQHLGNTAALAAEGNLTAASLFLCRSRLQP